MLDALDIKPLGVHPRVRGEHRADEVAAIYRSGSSPRPRGTLADSLVAKLCERFIPASAGNTPTPSQHGSPRAVHPRVRGEHRRLDRLAGATGGSSPRPRGTPLRCPVLPRLRRFIPASAGNTSKTTAVPIYPPVHPRVRGEHAGPVECTGHLAGSSPRPRGTRFLKKAMVALCRFIPASAGNTSSRATLTTPSPVHPRVRGEHCPSDVSDARR